MLQFVRALVALCWLLPAAQYAVAGALDQLTNADAGNGLKKALDIGINTAVDKLGITDGFFGNPQVKIPLPPTLQKTEKLLRAIGLGSQADQLTLTMNRAAEAAVPAAKTLLKQSLKAMTVKDAKDILTGGDDAATQYFKRTTYEPLAAKFKPIVAASTDKLQLAQQYNSFAAKGAQLGLLKPEEADLTTYVTRKALDGLYFMMANEEKAIRKDPLGQASSIVKKVFGALGKGG
jgi:Protein of unknown function (DUF4197)